MGVYKVVKDANGNVQTNPDGSPRMAPQRRDPTTAEVRSVLRQQHILQTRQQMQQSGEQRQYFTPAPPAPAPPTPPPTAAQIAASQTPLPQAPPVAPAAVEAINALDDTTEQAIARRPASANAITGLPQEAPKATPKPKRKAGKQKGLPKKQCEWVECDKGPGGLHMVFQPYRKYEKFCCDECREKARKKKARDRYHAKKKAKAAKA